MICISIAQVSRRLALVDILNASRQCDLLEIRLDHFGKSPEIGPLLEACQKPVIMTCRRQRDGGAWDGTEEERQAILRQCIISKPAYVELEMDIAGKIPRFGPTKRVISYTSLAETPDDVADIYARAQQLDPDVIKLTALARTPEEAWPLVQILARSPVPTVVVGLGKPGIMLTVLGKKIGAPWAYAALEKGMEAHPDQPTVNDLNTIYHYPAIQRTTRMIGVTGFGPREYATAGALNAALAYHQLPARCLPLGVGSARLFRKVIEAVRLAAVVVDGENRHTLRELAGEVDVSAERSGTADLLLHRGDTWVGYDTWPAALATALAGALKGRFGGDNPLQGRIAMLVGANDLARTVGQALQEQGVGLAVVSYNRDAAQALARQLGCRFLPQPEAVYTTMHDVLVVCDGEKGASKGRTGIQASGLKAGQLVLDLSDPLQPTPFLAEAQARGCVAISPLDLWLEQVLHQARRLTGKDTPRQHLLATLPWLQEG